MDDEPQKPEGRQATLVYRTYLGEWRFVAIEGGQRRTATLTD
jgi:hypothetical protein